MGSHIKMPPQADIKIKNGLILTMDRENTVIERGFLCISGDRISHVEKGHGENIQALKVIDAKGGLILPGLLNCHTHTPMRLFRGLARDHPLLNQHNSHLFPLRTPKDEDFVYTGTMLACAEMIMSGTTTFCDMALHEEKAAKAAQETGIRCLLGEVLHDRLSPGDGPTKGHSKKSLETAEALINKWQDDPLISISVAPHSPLACSPDLLRAAKEMADHYETPLVIHLAETIQELKEIKKKYRQTPVEHLLSLGLLGPRLIAAHCVHLGLSDTRILAEHSAKIIHSPSGNMNPASHLAPVPEMLKQGLVVGLGTDGCAWGHTLDLFTEMDITAKLHKISAMDPTAMDAVTVLGMSTIQGAKALGLNDDFGSLEPEKKADVIVVDTNKPHLTPMYNPFSQLVYSARGPDVCHSIINGKLVMEDRKLLTIDLEDMMGRAREKTEKIKEWKGR